MKAIETHYKGYRFRSRLEARWAVFFDSLNVEWQYELEGFDLGPAGLYLPDFYLPHVNLRFAVTGGLWIEIKPTKEIPENYEAKLYALARHSKTPVALLCGPVNNEQDDWRFEYSWDDEYGYRCDNYMMFMKCYSCGRVKYEFLESNYCFCPYCNSTADDDHPDIIHAVQNARSARFEHGETPVIK